MGSRNEKYQINCGCGGDISADRLLCQTNLFNQIKQKAPAALYCTNFGEKLNHSLTHPLIFSD